MKVLEEKPPIYDAIIANGMHPHEGVIYTYGDTIYNPSGLVLPEHLIQHELTHVGQQGTDPDAWWGRYLIDPYFRIEQESHAYAKQYDFMCKTMKDRNQRFRLLMQIANILSGPVYGNVITHTAALKSIKDKTRT